MMRLSDLHLPLTTRIVGDATRVVDGVSQDSRSAAPGDLWAALPGARVHGASFAAEVLGRGITAVLTDAAGLEMLRSSLDDLDGITVVVVDSPRAVLGGISAQVFGTDASSLTLYGLTGTNGKTTTAFILDALLTRLGLTTGLIGTVATTIAGRVESSVRTTPEAPDLHRLFARMRDAGVDVCSMEVSSHALAQHRADGAVFTVSGFTNLSQDHLDFHPTMEDYFAAKAALFTPEHSRRGVIVVEDEWGSRMARSATIPVATIASDPGLAPDHLLVREDDPERFTLHLAGGDRIRAASPLPGDFNRTNTALALAMLHADGVPAERLEAAAHGLEVVVPGRMERVHDAAPLAVVDYSHTPDALDKVLGGLSDSGAPLVVVVGAGGDRDTTKRPAMGAVAARRADVVIITDDNPRTEDPSAIRAALLDGARAAISDGSARVRPELLLELTPRGEAIARAVEYAGDAGALLVAGKGHETGQEIAGDVHPFDDRERTREAVASRAARAATGRVQD
ncbi:MAG: UDP-N-acetylmuramoyl-L-alanyl-D-glutamate--2,6-diaminopimelate ligase [Brevibacterium yomogidense]|uniref:UDP-N-acetylmuramoyl-L-alanyl-D-glutamate--2, 6-diaminopimelate ligase n=1 Tax=Brevibacterium sp. Mu109 TaxID=1255669 RepID=UPI000C4A9BF9|nr:UDP-N-acetylmuramoyl-L-alanyl-D-glutamate--2,6-diaminopimelate ligase [Brevibacterium sp. Mu109]SMX68543.1 UDP-N-acetylmuramoylalanyl-D-glutamate--2,6-diaminopimelate ligase [Brevibacterium sp. Mu109]